MGDQPKFPPCTWCQLDNAGVERDHVFPRAIGGTRDVTVPACRNCQDRISVAETELSRRSIYSIYLIDGASPKGRDKRRDPSSGSLQSLYSIGPHPLGGYSELAFRAGHDLPAVLPYIEIDVRKTKQVRRRGLRPEDLDRLVRAITPIFRDAPEQAIRKRKIPVKTEEVHEIGLSDDFWPRVALALDERPYIRARTRAEATQFARLVHFYVRTHKFGKYAGWESSEVAAGQTHWFALRYRNARVLRAIAKIACGLASIKLDQVHLRIHGQ